jgi:hypothetical protein
MGVRKAMLRFSIEMANLLDTVAVNTRVSVTGTRGGVEHPRGLVC